MQFNSVEFLFLFLPVFLAVYYIAPAKWRNFLLLAASLLFYWLNVRSTPWVMAVLLLLTADAYLVGMLLSKWKSKVVFGASLLLLTVMNSLQLMNTATFMVFGKHDLNNKKEKSYDFSFLFYKLSQI